MPFGRQGRPGLLGSVAQTAVISGTAQMTTAALNHRAQDRYPHTHPASSPQPMAGGDQLADQLARLANLHSTGLLTATEFAAAKARLLS